MASSAAGKERVTEMIRMTGYTYDENDDMAPVMDAVLKRLGFGVTYGKDDDGDWVSRVNHRDMEDALKHMSKTDREIIRLFFIERKSLLDISSDLGIPMEKVGERIRKMKARIRIWA